MRGWPLVVLSAFVLVGACGDDDDGGGGKNGSSHPDGGPGSSSSGAPGPQCTDCTPAGPMTFKLPSPAGATLWTTPTMEKVVREAAPPTNPGDSIQMYAAKNELEPFQLVVHADADSNVTLAMPAFGGSHDEETLWNIAGFVERLLRMTPEQYAALPDDHREGATGSETDHSEHSH